MADLNVGIKISDAAASASKLGKVEKGLNNIDKANKRMSISFRQAAIAAAAFAAAAAAITALGIKFLKLGADALDTRNKFVVTFGDMSNSVDAFIRDFNRMSGLSKKSAEDMLSATAGIVQGVGFAQKASAEFAIEVAKLAGDLASFKNVRAEDALHILNRAILGERESLKSLDIALFQVDVDQRALAETGKILTRELTMQDRAIASLHLITERAGVAMGDMERTANDTAPVMKQLSGAWDTLNQEVGKFIAESEFVNKFLIQIRDLLRNIGIILGGEAEQIASVFKELGTIAGNAFSLGVTGALSKLEGWGPEALTKNLPAWLGGDPYGKVADQALENMQTAMFNIAALANDVSNNMARAAASAERFARTDIKSWIDVPGVPGARVPIYGPRAAGGEVEAQPGQAPPGISTRPISVTTGAVPAQKSDLWWDLDEAMEKATEQFDHLQGSLGDVFGELEKLPAPINHAVIKAEALAAAEGDAAEAAQAAAAMNQRLAMAGINAAAALFRVAQQGGSIGGFIGAGLSIAGGVVGIANPLAGAALMAGGSVISSLGNKGEQPVRINSGQVRAIVDSNRERKTGPDSVVVIVEQAGVEIARIEQEIGRRERRDATNRIPSVPTPSFTGSHGSAYRGTTSTPRIGVPG